MSILFCWMLLLLTSCCKNEVCQPEPDPCDVQPCHDTSTLLGKLDTLWTTTISGVTGSIYTSNIFLHDSDIILVGFGSSNAFIARYKAESGENKWMWISDETSLPSSHIHFNHIITQKERDIYSVSLSNGELLIHYREPIHRSSHSFGQLIGNNYYFTIRHHDDSQAWLIRSHIQNLQSWDTIYTLKKDASINFDRPNIQSYNLWIHPSTGDSILIFQHRMLSRVDVVAWNMDKQEVMWRHDDIAGLGNSNHQQIIIHEEKAYFGAGTTFYCVEMNSGQILWHYDHPSGINSFMLYRPVIAEDENLIIVKDAGGKFTGFDLETGNIRMINDGSGHSTVTSGSPIYHKGIIYFTERSRLYAVRVSTGETLWEERSTGTPFGATSFQGEIAIDRERGILYATSSDKLFAIRVYEE
jgi:hypothetical protein